MFNTDLGDSVASSLDRMEICDDTDDDDDAAAQHERDNISKRKRSPSSALSPPKVGVKYCCYICEGHSLRQAEGGRGKSKRSREDITSIRLDTTQTQMINQKITVLHTADDALGMPDRCDDREEVGGVPAGQLCSAMN